MKQSFQWNYWHLVGPRFQPCCALLAVAEDISPCPISISGAAFPRQLLVYSIVRLEVGAPSEWEQVPRVGTPAPEVQRMGYTASA